MCCGWPNGMCKEWRNNSKCAELAKGGSWGVGGAKSTSVVSQLFQLVFSIYGHAPLVGLSGMVILACCRRNLTHRTPSGRALLVAASADLPMRLCIVAVHL